MSHIRIALLMLFIFLSVIVLLVLTIIKDYKARLNTTLIDTTIDTSTYNTPYLTDTIDSVTVRYYILDTSQSINNP